MSDIDKQLYEDIGSIKQHLINQNGSIDEIKEAVQAIRHDYGKRLAKIETDFASWKGKMKFASGLLGMLGASLVVFVKWLFFKAGGD